MKTEMKDRIRSRRISARHNTINPRQKLGVSRVSVTKWENGTTKPDGENLHQLALALEVSPGGFFMVREVAKDDIKE